MSQERVNCGDRVISENTNQTIFLNSRVDIKGIDLNSISRSEIHTSSSTMMIGEIHAKLSSDTHDNLTADNPC